jgi:transcriptional antiterminator RfaH
MSGTPYWSVVQTESQREHMVRLLLMRGGFETYAPRIKVKGRIAFLFPAYIFVRIIERFYPILWTNGVVRVLMCGDRPAHLPEVILEDIRKREYGGFYRLPVRGKMLKKGDDVKISHGSFAGQIGVYDGMAGKDRSKVLLELLGRQVAVELPQKDVQAIQPLASAS